MRYIPPEIEYIYLQHGSDSWPVSELLAACEKFNKGKIHNPLWYINRNYIVYVQCGQHKRCKLSARAVDRAKADAIVKNPQKVAQLYKEYGSSYKVAQELGISASGVRWILEKSKLNTNTNKSNK